MIRSMKRSMKFQTIFEIFAARQPKGCREACFRYTIKSEFCNFVCLYVRTNEMFAQMKLQNFNFKNMVAEGYDLGTSTKSSPVASI